MLDGFIIDQIRHRESKDDRQQPRLPQPGQFEFEEPPEAPKRRRREIDRDADRDADCEDDNDGMIIIEM